MKQLAKPVLVVAAVAALAILAEAHFSQGGPTTALKGENGSFTLAYPGIWHPMTSKERASLPGAPIGALLRSGKTGLIAVRRTGAAPSSFTKLGKDLTRDLRRRFPDFQKRSSRVVKVRAGKAFFYSYVRTKEEIVHGTLIVPVGKSSYTITTAISAGRNSVAREVGKILLTFNTQ